MKKFKWPILIFLFAVGIWYSTIYLVPWLALHLLKNNNTHCPSENILECKDLISSFGATGDIFGAVTSLFSGLALFAVAYTLWIDSNARKDARKPLVVTYLDADSIVLQNPNPHPNASASISINSNVSNKTGEAAMNVLIDFIIIANGEEICRETSQLKQPLVSGGSETASLSFKIIGDKLQKTLGALTEDNSKVECAVNTRYDSLEGVSWSTQSKYELTCKVGDRRKRLNSLRSGTDDFLVLWNNGATVPLDTQIQEGSWKHNRGNS